MINLRITDIKSDSDLLLIRQSKGNKDRFVSLPDKLLELLRSYYLESKPKVFLFEGRKGNQYSERSVQLVLKDTMKKAGVVSKRERAYLTTLLCYPFNKKRNRCSGSSGTIGA